jgi:hypothetical protein
MLVGVYDDEKSVRQLYLLFDPPTCSGPHQTTNQTVSVSPWNSHYAIGASVSHTNFVRVLRRVECDIIQLITTVPSRSRHV